MVQISTLRRDFLKKSTLLAGTLFTPYIFGQTIRAASQQAPSDRIRIGCIGMGGRGRGDAATFSWMGDVVAICDVDSEYGLANALNHPHIGLFRDKKKTDPDAYKDYRKILDRNDIDAISIGTVDHWHVKIAIEALMAGKHVFCQKPLTLTLEENQLIRQACLRYNKLAFQVGTQQRSQRAQFMTATLMVRKGMLGNIRKITCDVGGGPQGTQSIPLAEVPKNLDWDRWHGQVPLVPYRASTEQSGGAPAISRCHRTFRYWYEYGGGTFTDWGAHHIDCALWALGLQEKGTGPVLVDGTNSKHSVDFKNGYPVQNDRFNTSYEFDIVIKFKDGMEMHMVSKSLDNNGILFEGDKGRIHVNRERIKGKIYEENRPQFSEEEYRKLYNDKPLEDHKLNFIRCVREGGLCVSDVFSHVQAMNICHLSGISARLHRPIQWDPVKEEIVGDPEAASFARRERRKEYDIPIV